MSNGALNGRGRSLQVLGALRSTDFPEEHGGASSPPLSAEMHQVFAHAAALSGGLLRSPRTSCFSGRQQRLQSAVASAALDAKQSFNRRPRSASSNHKELSNYALPEMSRR